MSGMNQCRVCKLTYPLSTHFAHKLAESGSTAFYNCCSSINESTGVSCLEYAKKQVAMKLLKGDIDTKSYRHQLLFYLLLFYFFSP